MRTLAEPQPTAGAHRESPVPSRIADEARRIESLLRDEKTDGQLWSQLYAAQQALLWAVSDDLAAAPLPIIMERRIQPPRGTQAG
jgi:hypothetical protein